MNIREAKQQIKNAMVAYFTKDEFGNYLLPPERQRPVFLLGAPGIGKTAIMEQIAQELEVGFVSYSMTHHTRQSALGLPFIATKTYDGVEYQVSEYTMSEIIASVYEAMEATGRREGILFLDEINCVSETLAPTMLQFLQCKTFGNQAVPAGWVIVAAGNPPEYNKSVRDFDIVTLDRVRRMDIEPDLPVWKPLIFSAHIHSAILSYLELHPQNFYQINADVDGTQFVTARGWEDLSNLLDTYEALGLQADEELIREYIQHPKIAEDFSAYLDLYYKYRDDYGVEEILAGQAKPAVFARLLQAPFDERLSLVSLLLAGLNTRFAAARRADAVTDACYQEMRSFKRTLNNADPAQDGFVPAAVFAAQVNVYADHLTAQKAAGTLTGEELAVVTTASALLHAWVAALDPALDRDAAFDAVRASFNAQVRKREDAVGLAGDALESAFDFMESAFADGQEMVVFVNELALGPDSAAYLADNECERFETYSKRLLLHSGQDDILAELQRDDIRQGEHSMEF